ncbi:MAG: serine hydroxymethyltransferase, partial [Lentilactobacillus buchneri]|nr:serine hydroxymethyltransferase [Lentilactobacillus buchneri]
SDNVSVLTGGTDNHLMTLNLTECELNGKDLQNILDSVHITTNKESIPNDPLPPSKTSGLRLGTPAITTRGFDEGDARQVATLILQVIEDPENDANLKDVAAKVEQLTEKHPLD